MPLYLIKHHTIKIYRGQGLGSNLHMERAGLTEMFVSIYHTTRRQIPEDNNLQILMMTPIPDVTETTSVVQEIQAEGKHTQSAHCASVGTSCFTSAGLEPSLQCLSVFRPRGLSRCVCSHAAVTTVCSGGCRTLPHTLLYTLEF